MSANTLLHHQEHQFDVCVIGGGMAGMCAAIAAARNGAKTAIVHDRPVFGGNASSEIRMWICGAHGAHNKEAGILEEIQLENQYRNPTGNYSIWDSVLYGKIFFQPNLTPLINCSCTNSTMEGDRIVSIEAWQLTSQTWHTIRANIFIDCSGDSILAPLTGADFRTGRESRAEFNEDIEPVVGDGKTMGNTLLVQLRRTDEPQSFIPPKWAFKFHSAQDLPHRINGVHASNFWWLEIGGLQDTIKDAEAIRDELMKLGYGVWDYIKNRAPEKEQSADWALEWLGSLPGKRENRRYVGDLIMTQHDVRSEGHFPDVVAYGGWSMDDHHPAGIFYPGEPTIFHPAPSPYGIPYRVLYSRNISNLMFAGRNISVTHAALSSTRVMATCAILGQAVGTAAALATKQGCTPRDLSSGDRLKELQETLMDDDCWLPGVLRPISALARCGTLTGGGAEVEALHDGLDRDRPDETHAWTGEIGAPIEYYWNTSVQIGGVRIVFDSNLQLHKRMPCTYPHKVANAVPKSLAKTFRLEAKNSAGQWESVHREHENYHRLVRIPLNLNTTGLRLVVEETWGDSHVRLFAFEPFENFKTKIPQYPDGLPFSEVRAKISAEDLAPPDSILEEGGRKQKIGA